MMIDLNRGRVACALSVTAGAVFSAAGQATVAVPVDAIPRADVTPVFFDLGVNGDLNVRPPMHPPIDQIPAQPMPTGEPIPGMIDTGPGYAVLYEQATGVETFMPVGGPVVQGFDAPSGEAGFNGVDGAESFEDMFGARSFGTMSQVNESIFPWRMNTKLVIEYVDSISGNASYFVCSGSMNDAEVVLTAAHCVYNRSNDSSGNDFGFADRIWVYPGWDGNGGTGPNSDVSEHFGWGLSEFLGAFTGYTVDGNSDWDVGLIRITRAAGMLTGWFGLASDGNCAFVQSETYNVASYPSEGCGQPGLHNGQDMLFWTGTYDGCSGTNDAQLRLNTTPGCFTAQWGGMSGGNSYYFNDSSDRIAHAVVSHSNNATWADHTKVWGNFATYLNGQEGTARGATFDLQALQYRVTPTTITAGDTTSTARAIITNPTNANPASATYGLRTFLSTNNNISASDTVLNDVAYTFNYPAMGSADVGTGNVTIPRNTPSGTYWVGIELDAGIDSNNGNNDTDTWDAQQITVNGVADIVANNCDVPNGTAYHGDSIPVAYSVENEGGDPSNATTLTFYASTNTDISAADTFLGSVNIGTFSGGQTKAGSTTVNIPASLNGNYYIGYIASASDDAVVNQDNEAFDATTLNIQGRSDLFANYMTTLDNQVAVGGDIDVRFNVQNTGTISSGVYNVDVYASTNNFISVSDVLLGTVSRPSIVSGGSSTAIENIGVPAIMAPGLYYVGMIVNPGVNENNQSDNSAFDPDRVTFTDCPMDFDNNGIYDLNDITTFINAFTNQLALADLDSNGIWDLSDIVGFVDQFVAGCP